MNVNQWNALQVGDTIMYTGSCDYRDYIDTLCEVVFKVSLTNELTLKIIPTILGRKNLWGNGSPVADGWLSSSAFKFTLHATSSTSLPDRIHQKIKELDTKWASKQKEKGNAYALLLM